MTETQRYLFDLHGFLHLPALLTSDEASRLLTATRAAEAHALACRESSPKWRSVWGPEYWQSREHGYFAHGSNAHGQTLMIEDFWLFPDAFDFLIGHGATMQLVDSIVPKP